MKVGVGLLLLIFFLKRGGLCVSRSAVYIVLCIIELTENGFLQNSNLKLLLIF